MIACKIENIIMQTPIFSISSEAFKRMVLKGKGAEGRVVLQRPGPVLRQVGDAEKSSAAETRETGSHKRSGSDRNAADDPAISDQEYSRPKNMGLA